MHLHSERNCETEKQNRPRTRTETVHHEFPVGGFEDQDFCRLWEGDVNAAKDCHFLPRRPIPRRCKQKYINLRACQKVEYLFEVERTCGNLKLRSSSQSSGEQL